MEPASIRYKNPGAMWGNSLAQKWGAEKKAVTLHDGKGQGNNIAVFPTYIQGICAQMDLWRTSPNYKNKRFASAIAVWSGHNSVDQYITFVKKHAPGMEEETVMNDAFWRGPLAIPFLKAQAWHEAGKEYPAPEADWVTAHTRVLSGVPTKATVQKAAVSTTTILPVTATLHQSGISFPVALAIGIGIAVAVFLYWKFKKSDTPDTPHPEVVSETPSQAPESPVEPAQ